MKENHVFRQMRTLLCCLAFAVMFCTLSMMAAADMFPPISRERAEELIQIMDEHNLLDWEMVEDISRNELEDVAYAYAEEKYYYVVEYGEDCTIVELAAAILGRCSDGSTGSDGTPEPTPTVSKPAATSITGAVSVKKGIKLTWKKVSGATKYIVYRNNNRVKTLKTNTWTDTKATKNDKIYQYKVVAVNSAGSSKASTIMKAAYVAPVGLTKATNVSGKKISVQWKKNKNATGYQIKYMNGKNPKKIGRAHV